MSISAFRSRFLDPVGLNPKSDPFVTDHSFISLGQFTRFLLVRNIPLTNPPQLLMLVIPRVRQAS